VLCCLCRCGSVRHKNLCSSRHALIILILAGKQQKHHKTRQQCPSNLQTTQWDLFWTYEITFISDLRDCIQRPVTWDLKRFFSHICLFQTRETTVRTSVNGSTISRLEYANHRLNATCTVVNCRLWCHIIKLGPFCSSHFCLKRKKSACCILCSYMLCKNSIVNRIKYFGNEMWKINIYKNVLLINCDTITV
jgi:hypothetical protein